MRTVGLEIKQVKKADEKASKTANGGKKADEKDEEKADQK